MGFQRFPLLGFFLLLTGCYYAPDIKYQTMGSFVGGMGTGLAIVQSSVTSVTGGVIGGSMLGSMVGQSFDNYSPLATDDPIYTPVHRYQYQMIRPYLEVECFQTGRIYYNYSDQLPTISPLPPAVNQLD